ncbi:unnamed protein product [Pieris macdunnoughi]|uniref:Uncharacterized protein n=1 Tax=Pieris macdunnoughi TaxID=345717 RepID=A0A821XDM0_9NEOP|nr:unnamed protein product [Pieris macdunnoughi]
MGNSSNSGQAVGESARAKISANRVDLESARGVCSVVGCGARGSRAAGGAVGWRPSASSRLARPEQLRANRLNHLKKKHAIQYSETVGANLPRDECASSECEVSRIDLPIPSVSGVCVSENREENNTVGGSAPELSQPKQARQMRLTKNLVMKPY